MTLQDQEMTSSRSVGDGDGRVYDLGSSQQVAEHARDVSASAAAFSQLLTFDPELVDALLADTSTAPAIVVFRDRDLAAAPGWVLQMTHRLRAAGHRIALSDVGGSYPSLAILPLLRPDVLMVNVETVVRQPDWQFAQTLDAVTTYAEELPALVIATGITSPSDRTLALGFGATFGQGPLFAYRGYFPPAAVARGIQFELERTAGSAGETPFTVASARSLRTASRAQLARTSHVLETCAFDCDEATTVLSTFQKADNLTPEVVELYSALSRNLSYVFAFSHASKPGGPSPDDIPDLRVRTFDSDHPLSREWNVLVINARYQAMLAARETAQHDEDGPIYEYVLTHDRSTIMKAAQTLTPLLWRE